MQKEAEAHRVRQAAEERRRAAEVLVAQLYRKQTGQLQRGTRDADGLSLARSSRCVGAEGLKECRPQHPEARLAQRGAQKGALWKAVLREKASYSMWRRWRS